MEHRQALLHGESLPDIWQRAPEHRAVLVAASSEEAVRRAEQAVTLFTIDRTWRDHLALCADLRDGIHLVQLGGQDPVVQFTRGITEAFTRMEDAIEEAVLAALDEIRISGDELDLTALGMKRPSSTWTYLVNDDPSGIRSGGCSPVQAETLSIYSAAILMPLPILWGLVESFLLRRPVRRSDLFRKFK